MKPAFLGDRIENPASVNYLPLKSAAEHDPDKIKITKLNNSPIPYTLQLKIIDRVFLC